MQQLCRTCAILTCLAMQCAGAPIRVSFLRDERALTETIDFLRAEGCPAHSLAMIGTAVRHYNGSELALDTSGFPAPTNGYFHFDSGAHFARALPHRLCDTKHIYEINCFDTALILCRGQPLRSDLSLDDRSARFIAPYYDDIQRIGIYDSPREAFASMYPARYTNLVATVTGMQWSTPHISLTLSLRAFRRFPQGYAAEERDRADQLMKAQLHYWRREGIRFPEQPQLVMMHTADMTRRLVLAQHIGLLFREEGRSVYFEKAGGQGPFLRVDIEDLSDLFPYYYTMSAPDEGLTNICNFMSVNERVVCTLTPQAGRGE